MSEDLSKWEGRLAEYVPTNLIMDDPMNPNEMDKKQLDSLEFSMEQEANVVPIVLNLLWKRTGEPGSYEFEQNTKWEKPYMVINGHQRLKVLRRRKVERVAAVIVEMPLEEARAFGLGLNIHGQNDPEKLSNVFHYLYQANKLDLIEKYQPDFSQDYIKLSIDKFHHEGLSHDVDINDQPLEIPKSTKTKPGDVYQLGRHRLMCGDCTNPLHVKKLLGDQKIHHVNTDPPYGVDYHGGGSFLNAINPKTKRHQFASEGEDSEINYRQFFGDFLKLIPFHEQNTIYIFMAGARLHELRMALDDCKMTWSDYLIWVKNHFVMGRKDHKAMHEFIVYAWSGKHKFYGEAGTTTVYEHDRPHRSEEHPTMKPIELVARLMLEGSRQHDNVYEPFSGSGTCLLACEQEKRKFFGMEKIPHYVDLAINRWEQLTGKKAVKLEDNVNIQEEQPKTDASTD